MLPSKEKLFGNSVIGRIKGPAEDDKLCTSLEVMCFVKRSIKTSFPEHAVLETTWQEPGGFAPGPRLGLEVQNAGRRRCARSGGATLLPQNAGRPFPSG